MREAREGDEWRAARTVMLQGGAACRLVVAVPLGVGWTRAGSGLSQDHSAKQPEDRVDWPSSGTRRRDQGCCVVSMEDVD